MTVNAVWTVKNDSTSTGTINKSTETTTATVNKTIETTTAKEQVTTDAVKVGKSKVSKATKDKSAKKVKLSLKKVNGASGYQIQISKTKKFKTVIVKKNSKKVSCSLSSKKLKKQKKLYVRVRAFIKKDGTTYYGAWSNVKKVKIN